MNKDRIENYNAHAKFLADIAQAILNGNESVLNISGVKEIIALYLLIPYMSEQTLETPDEQCLIPNIKGEFIKGISYSELRNTISHSFITVEEDKNDGSTHGKYLIFDDRVKCDKKTHSKKGNHSETYNIMIDYAHEKLLKMVNEIREN